jgi:HEAT repeat protein
VGFFRQLCKKLVDDHSPQLETNLARIDTLSWLDDDALTILDSLSEAEQAGAILLAMRCRIGSIEQSRILSHVLRHGAPLGRQAAARALLDQGTEDDVLVLIDDECPLVQAEAARRLRSFDVPHAVTMLIDLLDSPHAEVQAAAREALDDFSLTRYLKLIDSLDEEARRSTGELVMRIHPDAASQLKSELAVADRTRRLRALQAVGSLDLASSLATSLMALVRDDSPAIRLEAVKLLGYCAGTQVRTTLRELLSDANQAVRQAAEQALLDLAAADVGDSTVRMSTTTVEVSR